MIVKLETEASEQLASLVDLVAKSGGQVRVVRYEDDSIDCGIDASDGAVLDQLLASFACVSPDRPFMLASREHRDRSVVRVGTVLFGESSPVFIAGPCVVDSLDDLVESARAVKAAGAHMLRGGAFKPRTSPYSFQGHGERALEMLAETSSITGLPTVTEVMEPDQAELVAEYADMLQIGSRNMANTPLLKRVGRTGKPVLLKRGFAATIEEWLMSAEYIMSEGNPNIVLCERGIRGFDPAVRFNLDLNAVPLARQLTHLPIIVDPSHGTGIRSLVRPMALAGIAAGADGLIIESQPDPESAKCDGYQTIEPDELETITKQARAIAAMLKAHTTESSQPERPGLLVA